jgi:hypothetical protein
MARDADLRRIQAYYPILLLTLTRTAPTQGISVCCPGRTPSCKSNVACLVQQLASGLVGASVSHGLRTGCRLRSVHRCRAGIMPSAACSRVVPSVPSANIAGILGILPRAIRRYRVMRNCECMNARAIRNITRQDRALMGVGCHTPAPLFLLLVATRILARRAFSINNQELPVPDEPSRRKTSVGHHPEV